MSQAAKVSNAVGEAHRALHNLDLLAHIISLSDVDKQDVM